MQTLVGGVARLAVGDATQSHLDAPHLLLLLWQRAAGER